MPKFSTPFIGVTHGQINYSFYYRSHVDTPYSQNDVYQHQVNSTAGVFVGNLLPFKITTLVRRTNSILYRSLTDVQAEFDGQQFQQAFVTNALKKLGSIAGNFRDSLMGLAASLKSYEYFQLLSAFNNKFTIQKIVEANEMLNVPELSIDRNLNDSAARRKSDSLKVNAARFLDLYTHGKNQIDSIKSLADSLKRVYDRSVETVRDLQKISSGGIGGPDGFSGKSALQTLQKHGIGLIPEKYKWIIGIRKFSVGRTLLNYSELTVKNISLNGMALEYNSWFYAAVGAGVVDFRFRDFSAGNSAPDRQTLFIARLGIGKIEKNFLIFSVFNGGKQIFNQGVGINPATYKITGISIEGKYQFSGKGFVKMEIAESVGPDLKTIPVKNNRWNLQGNGDKAYALTLKYMMPRLQSKFDGFYKFMGPNYQSFSTFETVASNVTYNLKWEQYLIHKQLRISASVRSNDFANSYFLQQYRSNAVFRSFQVLYRKRKWPVLSASYMPIAQLTRIGALVYENRFNALNVSVYHGYKMNAIGLNTTVMFSRFYNSSSDTGYIYFNARNIILNQLFSFSHFSTGVNVSYSSNGHYEFTTMDENIQVKIKNAGNLMGGLKIFNLNSLPSEIGFYAGYRLPVNRSVSITGYFEKGYVAGPNGSLLKNSLGNVQVSKSF